VGAVVGGVEPDQRDPVVDEPGVLARGHMLASMAAAGEELDAADLPPDRHPVRDGILRGLGQLERHWRSGLGLDGDVTLTRRDEVAAYVAA
jgi:hypothetical protein